MVEIINAVCDIIEEELEVTPVIGAMPPIGGVAIQQSSGSVVSAYFPRTGLNRTTLVVNAKDSEQEKAMEVLVDIHKVLTKRFAYPSTEEWQIATIRTVNSPDFLGQENDESYMYGSAIEVLWYDRIKAEDTVPQNGV